MSIIRWEDPPPDRFRWKNATEELKTCPGRWARVVGPTQDNDLATNALAAMKGHGCEAVSRKIDGEGRAVWARWPENPEGDA